MNDTPLSSVSRNPRNAGKRRDPAPRRVDATQKMGQFKNLDPSRHYVGVYKAAVENGIAEYEERGYVVEYTSEAGPKSITQNKARSASEPVEYRGHVLMSIARKDLVEQELSAQQDADAMERHIIRRDGMHDAMRGITGLRGRSGALTLGLENDTRPLEEELA